MTRFRCRLGTPAGAIAEQEHEAESAESLRAHLEDQGYCVLAVTPLGRTSPGGRMGRRSWRRRVRGHDLLILTQELLALVRAGLALPSCIDLLAERSGHPRLREALRAIHEALKGGAALSAAVAEHPRIFPPLYAATIRAGEQSGALAEALTRYLEFLRRLLALQKKVLSALLYPAVLACASTAVIIFLVTFVVPSFTQIYGDLDARLPLPTQILIRATRWFKFHLLWIGGGLAFGLVSLNRWRQTAAGRFWTDRLLLRLPALGEVFQQYALSLFCRTLGLVVGGGIPLVPALEVAAGGVRNSFVQSRLRTTIPEVAAGQNLASALERTGVAPSLAVEMIAVGESTGSLQEMLGHVADFFEGEIDMRLATLVSLVEPAIMISMGLVVATIVVIMYLPIFHLAQAIR